MEGWRKRRKEREEKMEKQRRSWHERESMIQFEKKLFAPSQCLPNATHFVHGLKAWRFSVCLRYKLYPSEFTEALSLKTENRHAHCPCKSV